MRPGSDTIQRRGAAEKRGGKIALRPSDGSREREAMMLRGQLTRAPLRETGQEIRSRLTPKLEVRSAANADQLEVRERRLQGSGGDEDRRQDETRQRSDYPRQPKHERQRANRCNRQSRSKRPRQVEPARAIDARVEVRKVHAIDAR